MSRLKDGLTFSDFALSVFIFLFFDLRKFEKRNASEKNLVKILWMESDIRNIF